MSTHTQSGKRSNIVCGICGDVGGNLGRKPSATKVGIPNLDKITTLSRGWDYAARVLLRERDNFILVPPDKSMDDQIAAAFYNHFSQFSQHSNDEIKEFEFVHLASPAKIDENRNKFYSSSQRHNSHDLKNKKWHLRRRKLPSNSGTITKSSVSCLYGAIVCCIMRDLSIPVENLYSKDENQAFAYGIYSVFRMFPRDARNYLSFIEMMKVMADISKYGYHGAAAINARPTEYCLKCYNRGKGKNSRMEKSEASSTGWVCLQCHSTEVRKIGFTREYLRKTEYTMFERATIITEFQPLYIEEIVPMYVNIVQNGPDVKKVFLERFKEYELEAKRDLLCKGARWVITHYDSMSNSKKRACYIPVNRIADIGINDQRYISDYKVAIAQFAALASKTATKAVIHHSLELEDGKFLEFSDSLYGILKELHWPEELIIHKVRADIADAFLSRQMHA